MVETDRRLVEDVEHPHQLRADLRRQPDPLRFAAGQRAGGAFERDVAEPDIVEEPQSLADFLQHLRGNEAVALARGQPLHGLQGGAHREPHPAIDVPVADAHRQALGLEPRPAAGRARLRAHELLDPGAHVVGLRLAIAPQEIGDHPLKMRAPADIAALARVADLHLILAAAVEKDLPRLRRELRERRIQRKAVFAGHRLEDRPVPTGLGVPPDRQRPLTHRQRGIGHHQLLVNL